MAEVYDWKELDEDTLAYLRGCCEDQGRRAPGVIIIHQKRKHVWGLLIGLVGFALLFGTLFIDDTALHLALLQTALLVTSTWLVLAYFRVLANRQSPRYIGHFLLVDASGFWEGRGDQVAFYPIEQIKAASCVHHLSGQTYQNTTLTVTTAQRIHTFIVHDRDAAARMVGLLQLLIEHYADPNVDHRPDATTLRGLGAQGLALVDEQLGTPSEPVNPEELLAVPRPRRVGQPSRGWLAYVLIVLAFVGLVPGLTHLNASRLEASFIEQMKKSPDPAMLRGYLLNPANQRYREAAKLLLTNYYDRTAESMSVPDTKKFPGKEASLRALHAKMQQIVRRLGQVEGLPLVSLTITEEIDAKAQSMPWNNEVERTERETAIRSLVVEQLENHLHSNTIQLARPEPNTKPQLELVYTLTPATDPANPVEVKWKLTLRTDDEDRQAAVLIWTTPVNNHQAASMKAVAQKVLHALGVDRQL
jgi:hypothetical protein